MSNRGIISFKLGGTGFDLVPSLENLDNLETSTNKPIYMVASNPKLSDSIKVILSCAKPKYGQIPNWFNAQGVYEQICKDKMIMDISLQVVKFCTNILTAGSDTDIKNVGADDSEGK